MKTISLFSILFCAIAMPALAELTEAALNKIRLIVKEEVSADRESFEKDIKEYINTKHESVDDKFEGIEKNFDRQNNVIIACIGIPLGILTICVTVWGIFANRRSPKVNEQREHIEELTREDMRIVEQLIRD